MNREELVRKYKDAHETASEKSLDWFCYGEGYAFLSGGADLAWVIEQLQKRRMVFVDAGVDRGYMNDTQYGTYGKYCSLRIQGLDRVIAEIEQLQIEVEQ